MNKSLPVISIIGCGYVGLTLATVLAAAGYRVFAVEIDPKRLAPIQAGRSFFYEAGADRLISAVLKSGRFIPTDSYQQAIPESDIIFSSVGTPDNPDGSSNLSYVFDAAATALPLMKGGVVFAQKSTVPVGTGEKIQDLFAASGKSTAYVSCPEFSREGTAIGDTLWFDRAIAGSDRLEAAEMVLDLHRTIQRNANSIAQLAGLTPPDSPPNSKYFVVSRNSAELIKVTANAFLALKISFANSIAKLADATDADIVAVMDGIGSDRRIGRGFLSAGRGYGGGCFPKDVSGLIRSAEEHGVEMEIMHAAAEVNDSMPHYAIGRAIAALGDGTVNTALNGQRVSVLGLSFKAGTSDVRKSPAVTIANSLARQGAKVTAFDPEAMDEAKAGLDDSILLADSVLSAIKDAVCIFITTDWPEFRSIDLKMFAGSALKPLIVDCMNCLDGTTVRAAGLAYIGIGKR